jgi:hypothetical protein
VDRTDLQRNEERRSRLRNMPAMSTFLADAAISVLDVGGGYGVVTEEILRASAGAGYLAGLFAANDRGGAAAARFACRSGRLCPVPPARSVMDGARRCPFDPAVSAIAIHNLGELAAMADCYRGIAQILKPGALFLDYDLFDRFGGIALHTRLLGEAGFVRVDPIWQQSPVAILAATS